MDLEKFYSSLRKASFCLSQLNAKQKNIALENVIKSLDKSRSEILSANKTDVDNARTSGMTESLIDRLSLNDSRIDGMIDSIRTIIASTDPIGTGDAAWLTPEGLSIRQVRVPIGVCAIIYESRPNVTVDAFALAYKSGNSILLRGSSSALNSNRALVKAIKAGLAQSPENCGIVDSLELADSGDRSEVNEILTAVGKIDVVLPRGGATLIKLVVENAKVPVIETGSGICHLFIDESAKLDDALNIAENAKLQRPGVCNAIECLVIHKNAAQKFLPMLAQRFNGRSVLKCDEFSYNILKNCPESAETKIEKAVTEDFDTEFLDYILAIKTVESCDEAISFINAHNTKHSESICTQNFDNARDFQKRIDAACVYVNASTRFTDGGVFGYGAELGISTQKLHVRGPMGLTALTTIKYLIEGSGHIR